MGVGQPKPQSPVELLGYETSPFLQQHGARQQLGTALFVFARDLPDTGSTQFGSSGFYPQAADWTEGLGQSTDRAALDTTRTCLCEISDHYRYRPGASLHLPALSAVDNYPVYGL